MLDFKLFNSIDELKLTRVMLGLIHKVADQSPQNCGINDVRMALDLMERIDAKIAELEPKTAAPPPAIDSARRAKGRL